VQSGSDDQATPPTFIKGRRATIAFKEENIPCGEIAKLKKMLEIRA
jgi:hypothetical protein